MRPEEMVAMIQAEKPFEGIATDYSFRIKIEYYAPYICGAVHDGHQIRKSLWEYCTHTQKERRYDEDPCTLQKVASHPEVIAGCDRRIEYYLNRPPEQ